MSVQVASVTDEGPVGHPIGTRSSLSGVGRLAQSSHKEGIETAMDGATLSKHRFVEGAIGARRLR